MRRGTAFVALLLLAGLIPRVALAGPALVIEVSNSKVLYAEDADSLWHPASLTKVMTAYLVFEALKAGKLDLKSKISCSSAANQQPPSKIGLPVGGEMTVDQGLQSLIIKSANDVAVMFAEAVAGSEVAFVANMNATARRLGMSRTVFVNPNGLPNPAQVTTARDLALLSRAIINDFPEYAHYWAKPEMRLGRNRLVTHNGLLRSFEGADGLKTGFTCDSGFNVIATATRDGRRIIAVVLGDTEQRRAQRARRQSARAGLPADRLETAVQLDDDRQHAARNDLDGEERAQRRLLVGLQGAQGSRRQGGQEKDRRQGRQEEAGGRDRRET